MVSLKNFYTFLLHHPFVLSSDQFSRADNECPTSRHCHHHASLRGWCSHSKKIIIIQSIFFHMFVKIPKCIFFFKLQNFCPVFVFNKYIFSCHFFSSVQLLLVLFPSLQQSPAPTGFASTSCLLFRLMPSLTSLWVLVDVSLAQQVCCGGPILSFPLWIMPLKGDVWVLGIFFHNPVLICSHLWLRPVWRLLWPSCCLL